MFSQDNYEAYGCRSNSSYMPYRDTSKGNTDQNTFEPVPLGLINQNSTRSLVGSDGLDILSEFASFAPSFNARTTSTAQDIHPHHAFECKRKFQSHFGYSWGASSPDKRAKQSHSEQLALEPTPLIEPIPIVPSSLSSSKPQSQPRAVSSKISAKGDSWDVRVSELHHFIKVFGHSVVPHNYEPSPPLAQWVKRQRYQHKLKTSGKHSTLSDERQAELEALGFVWDSHAAKWEERMNELVQFKNKYGHCNVPITSKDQHQLAIWVKCQRRMYLLRQKGQKTGMSDERIERLQNVGFVWFPRQM